MQIESQVAAVTKKVINTPSKAPGADETWPQETLETVAAGWTPVKTLEVRRKRPCWMMCLCIPFPARSLSCALLAPTRQSYRRTDLAVQHGCQQRFCAEQEVDTENCVEEDVPMDSEEHEEGEGPSLFYRDGRRKLHPEVDDESSESEGGDVAFAD